MFKVVVSVVFVLVSLFAPIERKKGFHQEVKMNDKEANNISMDQRKSELSYFIIQ